MSIPKIVHYCWFGGKPLPEELQKCVDSWQILDDYTIMRWDEGNCSFDENEFVRKSFSEKKLGFIGDYYRLKAVYEYGGIYLDTDVKVFKKFDDLLKYPAFFNFIFDDSVGTAIIGAEPHNPLIKALLDMYDSTVFMAGPSGKTLEWVDGKLMVKGYATSNYYYTYYFLKNVSGFLLNNKFQKFEHFVIFPKELFEIGTLTGRHYAIHYCAGAWKIKVDDSGSFRNRIKRTLKKAPWLFDKVQIIVRKNRYRKSLRDIPFYECYLAQRNKKELPEL